ncbi:MAG: CocE/NonD family hydrolase [Actinomycetota bacterium]|nr:CocE/NonD family hydrolase [Actinomycetota bacterium]
MSSQRRISRRSLLGGTAALGAAGLIRPLRPASASGPPELAPPGERQARFFEPTYDFALERGWLPMPDGVRLSVEYYRPVAKAAGEAFPIVLEALPYRKDDSFATRDYPIYSYLARRGIAAARVDVRGTGASEGRAPEREYSDAELDDLVEVVAQLARLPWSNGNIGMQGKSWSAFNGIMTAMRRPPQLKALLLLHGSQDIYANDLHYIDGPLHIDIFEVEMMTENGLPAPPDYRLDEAYFRDRFDVAPWTFLVMRHQRDGDFWRPGRSLFTDYGAIDVPVYAIGSLLDGYHDFVVHMLANVKTPMKGEMGPWNHAWPHTGAPGPDYEWRQTAVRWWQQWLNGVETGVMAEPRFAVFVRGAVPPDIDLEETPGTFWAEDWPVERAVPTRFLPQRDGTLTTSAGTAGTHTLAYKADAGRGLLNWWGETTGDTRPVDEDGLVYDSPPLQETMYVLGVPRVRLTVSADAPLAHWVARLEDVQPDGSVSLVTGGAINGAQRESRTDPQPIERGVPFTLEFPMRFTTWTFEPGHRIRLLVSNGQFGMSWPTPYPMTTTLAVGDGASELVLPVVTPTDQPPPPLLPPEPEEERPETRALGPNTGDGPDEGRPGPTAGVEGVSLTPYRFDHDPTTGVSTASAEEAAAWAVGDREYRTWKRVAHRVHPDDPAHAGFLGEGLYEVRIGERTVMTQATLRIDSDVQHFHVWCRREISENGEVVREREWHETIPRDFQ